MHSSDRGRVGTKTGITNSLQSLLPHEKRNSHLELYLKLISIQSHGRQSRANQKDLKSAYDLDGVEEVVYDNILLTYKDILRIKRRMRFLSDRAFGNAEKAIKQLVNQTFDSEEYGIDKQMNTANLPINLKVGSLYLKRRIEIIWEFVERVVKVAYFLEPECNSKFLMRMCENPAELSTIFNQQEWENHLEECETFLHQERFVQAEAINCAWKRLETSVKTTKPDFKLYKFHPPKILQYAGKGFFGNFEDVIDTKSIYDGSSERGTKYGTNCIAYLCYVEAKQVKQEKRAACW